MKQIIIVRKDLNMSKGKMAAQVAHASMAFLTNAIKHGVCGTMTDLYVSPINYYKCSLYIPEDIYKEWICGSFTKIILEAKNKHQLEKVYKIAEEIGLEEGVDYFPIKDNCYTELEPEEVDENGVGRTLTCVGFIPLKDEIANKISKKYQLYKD
jgi:PTH2 family peptidyl-tRNA hydrolase